MRQAEEKAKMDVSNNDRCDEDHQEGQKENCWSGEEVYFRLGTK